MSSFFSGITEAQPIEVFYMNKLYLDETDSRKVNLTIGAYRTEEGKPWVLPVVHEAESRLAADDTLNHEYLPVLGFEPFCNAARDLVLGADSPAIKEGRAFGVQCLSGTGSLRAGAEFLARLLSFKTAYKNHFTFFDIAYQGFASGDPDADAWAIRYFVEQGLEMVIAQSFAKNFGLYNERVGNLTVVVNDPKVIPAIKSQMSLVIRANWSNPPAHGAKIVHMVLTTPDFRKQWFDAIQTMSSRIREMRAALRKHLEDLGTPGKWDHITQQIGMFSYTGLTANQVEHLVKEHKVFLLKDGRINLCGLNTKNVEYVAKAFDETVRNVQSHI
uniref:Aspartate aminotransferase n=1 Tax=Panagrolaimus sp. ES5 TaxID=591445 RepID=A0AC34FER3_9BILA